MAGEGKGWISLYRSIQDHWLWREKPFSKGQAWMDLLLSANHQDKKIVFDSNLIEVKRGQFITSIRKLCDRWGWSNSKVKKFLELLQGDGMLTYKSDTKKTTINIEKYELYQSSNDTKNDAKASQKHHRNATETPQKHTNNNDNNVNNDNKYINNKEEVNPIKVYQNNIYPMPGVIEIEGINQWSNDLGNELVIYAIDTAAKNNARNWRYIERILIDWNSNGIKTLDQAKAYSEDRKKKGGQNQNDRDRTDNTKNEVKYDFSKYEG
ncbi:DnaD domain protein [Clostridium botulinum]|uniref:DnaD domain-containing protein n=1 Tax=Clostridium botulinum TaxID=1491 RepID=UPI000A177B58|nr:DnaD domain protein [Clostridium botulinum]MBY6800147.1 DnaD domain protein [Clostridium botulinum]NFF20631.1 DnaD domain protein [Clostridium botulinum]NFM74762.1 DnaD domain protein [Clostridium botulinum]NFP79383.1 DnaD domain protein [Clostridium botulinum]NFP93558.1 DnaD domain protein [Clostridium botulinum]